MSRHTLTYRGKQLLYIIKRSRRRRRLRVYAACKARAMQLVKQRLNVYHTRYGFSYGRVVVRDTISRWGSCSKKGNLNFSYRLLFLPLHLADYVIVHELCHLAEFNHSRRFWQLVERTMPNHKFHRKELRKYDYWH